MRSGAEIRKDRTGTGTVAVFGACVKGNLQDGFPLLTTKKMRWHSILTELLWFIRGETNVRWLNDRGVSIWDDWAGADDDVGPVYGAQWRKWAGVDGATFDQLSTLITNLKTNPFSRRHVVSAWNVGQLADMQLPPCHLLFQCFVRPGGEGKEMFLDLMMYQR